MSSFQDSDNSQLPSAFSSGPDDHGVAALSAPPSPDFRSTLQSPDHNPQDLRLCQQCDLRRRKMDHPHQKTEDVAPRMGSQSSVNQESRTIRNKDRLSSASMPQLGGSTDGRTGERLLSYSSTQKTATSDTGIHKRGHTRGRHSSRIHIHHRHGGETSLSTPSSPLTSGSARSHRDRHSSMRRTAATEQVGETSDPCDQQVFRVTCRKLSSYRVVYLLNQNDVELFDSIQAWKNNHPTLWVDDAIDAFGELCSSAGFD